MAELADALASGASVLTDVLVQLQSRAPKIGYRIPRKRSFLIALRSVATILRTGIIDNFSRIIPD